MTESNDQYDAVIAGGGHNGLVCSYYLARAGLDVLVVEQRSEVGGPCSTIEPMPGYRLSFANSPGSLDPKVSADMNLTAHGLRYVKPNPSLVHPFPTRQAFIAWREPERVRDVIAGFDARDVDGYQALMEYCEWFADRLDVSLHRAPPTITELTQRLETASDHEAFGRFFFEPVKDLLDQFLHSEEMKAVVGTLAIMSTNAGPMTPGTALMLLWRPLSKGSFRQFLPDDPRQERLRGSTGLPIGGMGSITQAMASAARAAGVTIQTNAQVEEILEENGRVVGLTVNGRTIRTNVVASNVDPWQTLLELLPERSRPMEVVDELESVRPSGNAFKLAIALDGLPKMNVEFEGDPQQLAACQFRIADSLAYLERSWDDCKYSRPASAPVFWGLIPSVTDPDLAPEGKHIMSVNIHHTPTDLGSDKEWSEEKTVYAKNCIDELTRVFPDIQERIIDFVAWSPKDLERELRLPDGNISHGDMLPSNTFGLRPTPSLSGYRTPVSGLYLCGSASYPGGYVTGLPGHNAAHQIILDKELN